MSATSSGPQFGNQAFSNIRDSRQTEPMPTLTQSFMAEFNATFMQPVFQIRKRLRATKVLHRR